jgi:Ca-activated chloride channel family protein
VIDLLWPGFLALLLLVPAMVMVYVLAQRRRKPSGVRFSSLSLVREAMPGTSRIRRHLPFAFFALGVASLVLAMARPVVVAAVPTNQTTVLLTIDVSGSMCSTDVTPSRIEAAEAAAASFINNQSASTQIGIVAFSGFAELVQAPTTDKQALLDALHSLATGRRTAIGSGLLAALDAIAAVDPAVKPTTSDGQTPVVPVPPGAFAPDIVVLLTDGASNTGPDPLTAAQQAADRGVRVFTIGFGTANGGAFNSRCAAQFLGREPGTGFGGGNGGTGGGGFGGGGGGGGAGNPNVSRRGIDEVTLKKIADLTGGKYYPAESAGDLEQVFAGLPMSIVVKHETVEAGAGLVALATVFTGLAFLLGRLWRPLP